MSHHNDASLKKDTRKEDRRWWAMYIFMIVSFVLSFSTTVTFAYLTYTKDIDQVRTRIDAEYRAKLTAAEKAIADRDRAMGQLKHELEKTREAPAPAPSFPLIASPPDLEPPPRLRREAEALDFLETYWKVLVFGAVVILGNLMLAGARMRAPSPQSSIGTQ